MTEDTVIVHRATSVEGMGRGYGDDYSPWLVGGAVGSIVRARAAAVTEEGLVAA